MGVIGVAGAAAGGFGIEGDGNGCVGLMGDAGGVGRGVAAGAGLAGGGGPAGAIGVAGLKATAGRGSGTIGATDSGAAGTGGAVPREEGLPIRTEVSGSPLGPNRPVTDSGTSILLWS